MRINTRLPPENDDLAGAQFLGLEDDVFDLLPGELINPGGAIGQITVGATEIAGPAELDLHGQQPVGRCGLADLFFGKFKIVELHPF